VQLRGLRCQVKVLRLEVLECMVMEGKMPRDYIVAQLKRSRSRTKP